MATSAVNYNPEANTNDESCCFIAGCTDEAAFNYNMMACYDDDSCVPVIYGCLDDTACNYNEELIQILEIVLMQMQAMTVMATV